MTTAVGASAGASAGGMTAGGIEAARAHVRQVVERSGTSFAMGMRILSPRRRDAMYAVYAFCREVDDIADEPGREPDKLRALDAWRDEIDGVFAGRPQRPTGVALVDAIEAFGPPKAEFEAMIDGMEMDAREQMRRPSRDTLDLYCRRVAGAVGLMSLPIFGTGGASAETLAIDLGRALQLTNILRDLDEDAERGRLYLPDEDLAAAGIGAAEADRVLADSRLGAVCRQVAGSARASFTGADRALVDCDRRALRPALLMMGVYDALSCAGWSPPTNGRRAARSCPSPQSSGPACASWDCGDPDGDRPRSRCRHRRPGLCGCPEAPGRRGRGA